MDETRPTTEPRLTRRNTLTLAAAAGVTVAAQAWTWPLSAAAVDSRGGPIGMALDLDARDFAGGGARAATSLRTSRVIAAPRRFDLVGLRWAGRKPVRAVIRTRREGGEWGRWTDLPAGSDHAPDGERRRASEPVWVGGSDELQLRLPAGADMPRIHLVASRHVRPRAEARAAAAPGPGGGPLIIPRAQWGGDRVTPRAAPSYGEVQFAFVHHTVTSNAYGPGDSAAMVLAIAKYHRDANGWNDIGYNFLVDQFGQIFEGRTGGIERAVIGAQVQGYNGTSTGVAVLGTHGAQPASEATLAALGQLIGWKLARHAVPTAGTVRVGRGTFERIVGHRDANRTECPGAAMHRQLPEIRRRAAAAAVGVRPAPPPEPVAVSSRISSKRVRARGRGVLVRGSSQGDGAIRVTVSRQVGGRWRWARTVSARRGRNGAYAVRVRLAKPGLYRLTAVTGGVRAEPLFVRSVRG